MSSPLSYFKYNTLMKEKQLNKKELTFFFQINSQIFYGFSYEIIFKFPKLFQQKIVVTDISFDKSFILFMQLNVLTVLRFNRSVCVLKSCMYVVKSPYESMNIVMLKIQIMKKIKSFLLEFQFELILGKTTRPTLVLLRYQACIFKTEICFFQC